jgi:ubiquinone/menaquinone biosynthesis C-methylase UbiE
MTKEQEQQACYESYYRIKGTDRNDPRLNRGALLQVLAAEAALIRACSHIPGQLGRARLLDVGCGSGARFFELFRLGFKPENVVGVDLQQERIDAGREILPQVQVIRGDATAMTFGDDSFNIVFESGMFATLPADEVRCSIAHEMLRVCSSGGYLLLSDWRTPKYGDKAYKALTVRDLRQLFDVGKRTALIATERGALVPPAGRFLSAHMSSLYFPVAAMLPFLVGQVVYVLRKFE